jgi:flagellar hook assembly protein FlgD
LNIPADGYVSLQAYNLAGQVVGTIAEGNMSAGTHSFAWDASDLSSGVYLIKAEYAGSVSTQKVILAK